MRDTAFGREFLQAADILIYPVALSEHMAAVQSQQTLQWAEVMSTRRPTASRMALFTP